MLKSNILPFNISEIKHDTKNLTTDILQLLQWFLSISWNEKKISKPFNNISRVLVYVNYMD